MSSLAIAASVAHQPVRVLDLAVRPQQKALVQCSLEGLLHVTSPSCVHALNLSSAPVPHLVPKRLLPQDLVKRAQLLEGWKGGLLVSTTPSFR